MDEPDQPETPPGPPTEDTPVGTTADAPAPDGTAAPTPDRGRTALVAAGVAVLIVLVGALALLLNRGGEPEPVRADPTTSTTSTSRPEVTQDSLVATTKPDLGLIAVLRDPPPEWEAAGPGTTYGGPAPGFSQPTAGERPALPREDFPIEGRYATPTGWEFSNPTSLGDPFVMLVTERRGDWLRVLLPVRPNGTQGYVRVADVDLTPTNQRLELHLAERRLTFFEGDQPVAETTVVIGRDDTRTPTGRFYLTDKVEQSDPTGVYGPLVLATSGYSEQLDVFSDGVPVIALHGTNQPSLMGQAASNGCVRLPNDVVVDIGNRAQLGIPVDVYA